ncbi:MAG: hypothetical protein AAFN74_20355, partial [Myxococcota bacterium]
DLQGGFPVPGVKPGEETYVEPVNVEMRAITLSTAHGFGVAVAHPFHTGGVICWFRDEAAFAEARQQARHGRRNGRDIHAFRLADRQEAFTSEDEAVKALLFAGS